MDKFNLKEKRGELAKSNAKIVIATVVLALTIVLFICCTIQVADVIDGWKTLYQNYAEMNEATRTLQIQFAIVIMKHITNIAIAGFLLGIFAKKRSEIASEIKSRNVIKLEANTIPCPKCEAEIERNDAEHSLQCPNCGASYKNPFYKG